MIGNDNGPLKQVPLNLCGLARALNLLGDRWTLLILREAFYGVRRFDAMCDDLGASRSILSARLSSLVTSGLLRRTPYREGAGRTRNEYMLTGKGVELLPALLVLMQWGDRHLCEGEPPLWLQHIGCGGAVSSALLCERGHSVALHDIRGVTIEGS